MIFQEIAPVGVPADPVTVVVRVTLPPRFETKGVIAATVAVLAATATVTWLEVTVR